MGLILSTLWPNFKWPLFIRRIIKDSASLLFSEDPPEGTTMLISLENIFLAGSGTETRTLARVNSQALCYSTYKYAALIQIFREEMIKKTKTGIPCQTSWCSRVWPVCLLMCYQWTVKYVKHGNHYCLSLGWFLFLTPTFALSWAVSWNDCECCLYNFLFWKVLNVTQ